MPSEVEQLLKMLQCEQYVDIFERYGYKTLQSMCQIQPQMLQNMGIHAEHCQKIIDNIALVMHGVRGSQGINYSDHQGYSGSSGQVFPHSQYYSSTGSRYHYSHPPTVTGQSHHSLNYNQHSAYNTGCSHYGSTQQDQGLEERRGAEREAVCMLPGQGSGHANMNSRGVSSPCHSPQPVYLGQPATSRSSPSLAGHFDQLQSTPCQPGRYDHTRSSPNLLRPSSKQSGHYEKPPQSTPGMNSPSPLSHVSSVFTPRSTAVTSPLLSLQKLVHKGMSDSAQGPQAAAHSYEISKSPQQGSPTLIDGSFAAVSELDLPMTADGVGPLRNNRLVSPPQLNGDVSLASTSTVSSPQPGSAGLFPQSGDVGLGSKDSKGNKSDKFDHSANKTSDKKEREVSNVEKCNRQSDGNNVRSTLRNVPPKKNKESSNIQGGQGSSIESSGAENDGNSPQRRSVIQVVCDVGTSESPSELDSVHQDFQGLAAETASSETVTYPKRNSRLGDNSENGLLASSSSQVQAMQTETMLPSRANQKKSLKVDDVVGNLVEKEHPKVSDSSYQGGGASDDESCDVVSSAGTVSTDSLSTPPKAHRRSSPVTVCKEFSLPVFEDSLSSGDKPRRKRKQDKPVKLKTPVSDSQTSITGRKVKNSPVSETKSKSNSPVSGEEDSESECFEKEDSGSNDSDVTPDKCETNPSIPAEPHAKIESLQSCQKVELKPDLSTKPPAEKIASDLASLQRTGATQPLRATTSPGGEVMSSAVAPQPSPAVQSLGEVATPAVTVQPSPAVPSVGEVSTPAVDAQPSPAVPSREEVATPAVAVQPSSAVPSVADIATPAVAVQPLPAVPSQGEVATPAVAGQPSPAVSSPGEDATPTVAAQPSPAVPSGEEDATSAVAGQLSPAVSSPGEDAIPTVAAQPSPAVPRLERSQKDTLNNHEEIDARGQGEINKLGAKNSSSEAHMKPVKDISSAKNDTETSEPVLKTLSAGFLKKIKQKAKKVGVATSAVGELKMGLKKTTAKGRVRTQKRFKNLERKSTDSESSADSSEDIVVGSRDRLDGGPEMDIEIQAIPTIPDQRQCDIVSLSADDVPKRLRRRMKPTAKAVESEMSALFAGLNGDSDEQENVPGSSPSKVATDCGSKPGAGEGSEQGKESVYDQVESELAALFAGIEEDKDMVPEMPSLLQEKHRRKSSTSESRQSEILEGSDIVIDNEGSVTKVKLEQACDTKEKPFGLSEDLAFRQRGRPKGSKNKVKKSSRGEGMSESEGEPSPKKRRKSRDSEDSGKLQRKGKKLVPIQDEDEDRTLSTKVKKMDSKETKRKPILEGLSEKFRGPYIHVEGCKDDPLSVTLVNAPVREEEENDKSVKSKKKYTFFSDPEQRGKMGRVGFTSTLSLKYDAITADKSWYCVFCKRNSNYKGLGDLFGPYYIDNVFSDSEDISGEDKDDLAKRASKRVSKRSELVEQFFQKEMSKKGKKSPKKEGECPGGSNLELSGAAERVENLEVWVHETCLIWTPGIYLVGHKIEGLDEAVGHLTHSVCRQCQEVGANISCVQKGCEERLHYICAREYGWDLDEQNYVAHCSNHKFSEPS